MTVNIDELSREQRSELEIASTRYAAAVSAYNDHDAKITVTARDYADHPWDAYGAGEIALPLMLERESKITELARAKAKFAELHKRFFNCSPGIS